MKRILIVFVAILSLVPANARVCIRDKTTGTATAGTNVMIKNQTIEKSGRTVTVNMLVQFLVNIPNNAVIATLPDGFRPTGMFHATLVRNQSSTSGSISGTVSVNTDGRIINTAGSSRAGDSDGWIYMLNFTFMQ